MDMATMAVRGQATGVEEQSDADTPPMIVRI
jgi:hypothetical protein